MGSNDQVNDAVLTELCEMRRERADTRREHQIGFAAMLESIEKMGLKMDGIEAVHLLEKKRDAETSEAPIATRFSIDEDEALRGATGKAHGEFGEFNPHDVYHTLIDPFRRTRQERVEYAKEAAQVYESSDLVNVQEVFKEKFQCWSEKQFKTLPSSVVSRIRKFVLQEHITIEKRLGPRMSSELAQYIPSDWKNTAMPNSINEKCKASKVVNDADERAEYSKSLSLDVIEAEADEISQRSSHERPRDVLKLFQNQLKYTGGPNEPLPRRYKIFPNAGKVSSVNIANKKVMLSLMQAAFLKESALLHFIVVVLDKTTSPNHAVDFLELFSLDERAKHVDANIWMELTFDSVTFVGCSRGREVTFEAFPNDLIAQASELADIRTGSEDSAEMMSKTIAVVRAVEVFSLGSRNSPKNIRELNSALRARASETDRGMLKGMTKDRSYEAMHYTLPQHSESTESMLRTYLVDRKLQRNYNKYDSVRRFKACGDGKPAQRNQRGSSSSDKPRDPRNVCMVYNMKSCHSSNHCKAGRQIYICYAKAYLAGGQSDDDDEDPAPEESDHDEIVEQEDAEYESESFITFVRVTAAMRLVPKKNSWVVEKAMIDTGSNVVFSV